MYDPIHQGILFGLFLLLGFGIEHLRIRFFLKRKQKLRRASLGVNYRKEPEPTLARWTPDHGRAQWR